MLISFYCRGCNRRFGFTNHTYLSNIKSQTSFIMFHYLTGTPFEWNQGEQDELTLWEQIDNGAQFTPTKKFLTAVPIVLFLLSTHYTHYDLPTFSVNLVFVLVSLIAKLPSMHRVRLFGGKVEEEERSKDE